MSHITLYVLPVIQIANEEQMIESIRDVEHGAAILSNAEWSHDVMIILIPPKMNNMKVENL